jgi:hypothetical protein
MSVTTLEWWPDYGLDHPLWLRQGRGGAPVDLVSLRLPGPVAQRLRNWTAAYQEDKIPDEADGDTAWLAEGVRLLGEVRAALGDEYRVVVTEPWWGEEPAE